MVGNMLKLKSRAPVRLIIMSTALSLFFLLNTSSCNLINPQVEDDMGKAKEEVAEEGEGEITAGEKSITQITLWDCLDPKERFALIESVDNFMVENEYIDIEIGHFRNQEELEDQFEAASLAGAGPELMLIDFDSVQRLVPGNVVKEIVDEADYSLFLGGLVEISEYNNRNYVIPFRSFDFLALFYNKDLIDKPPMDFEEVIEYCKEVNNFKEWTYGFLLNASEPDWIIPFIGGYADWIVDYGSDSLTLDTNATVKTMEFLTYIYNEEKILPYNIEYGEINELFKSGNAYMIINNIRSIKEYQEAGLNFGVSKIPRAWQSNKYPTPLISGLGFIINLNCYGSELEAVNKFIQYMLTEEVQIDWTSNTDTFPVLENIDRNEKIRNDDIVYGAFQQAKLCRGKPHEELIRVIRDAIRDNVKNVISGDMLPGDAALKIQEDALRLRSGAISVEEAAEVEETEEAVDAEEIE
ncbi:MAG: extracellular solute-binding protein [Actinobacteria bacterium]|nr:MAG: extracellular solute-binding protein [Actinomycetota bacterium]